MIEQKNDDLEDFTQIVSDFYFNFHEKLSKYPDESKIMIASGILTIFFQIVQDLVDDEKQIKDIINKSFQNAWERWKDL